jgi:hypothetical protein
VSIYLMEERIEVGSTDLERKEFKGMKFYNK